MAPLRTQAPCRRERQPQTQSQSARQRPHFGLRNFEIMLRKVDTQQLQPGMFLHALCGTWVDHPFWRSSFKLKDRGQIAKILDSGIKEALIDTDKGLDIPAVEAPPTAQSGTVAPSQPAPPALIKAATAEPTPIAAELERASRIITASKQAVMSMFNEARMGKAIEADNVMPLVEDISSSVARNPGALISIARLKSADDYTYMHSVAVCGLMIALARQLDLDEVQTREAGMAGLLHDVGKMAIPLEVLNKPGKLTDAEFAQVKNHPLAGHEMLANGKGVSAISLDVCIHHHEKVDGSGYPHKLAGDNISLYAKMGAVCDVYDAITSERPYKKGWDPGEAVHKMAGWSKGHFDELVFKALVKSVGIYPVGSLVRLQSGRLGVVIEQTGASLLLPRVKVFFSVKSQVRLPPEIVDLSRATANDRIIGQEDPAKWGFADINELWGGGTAAR
jgi:HD-GYP domain-containing protein (c-di-GMP phosphodiesterase class II)